MLKVNTPILFPIKKISTIAPLSSPPINIPPLPPPLAVLLISKPSSRGLKIEGGQQFAGNRRRSLKRIRGFAGVEMRLDRYSEIIKQWLVIQTACHANGHRRMDNETFIKNGGKLISIIYIGTSVPDFQPSNDPVIFRRDNWRNKRQRKV